MPSTLTDSDWDYLIRLIKAGECTPIIGAGASVPTLPAGQEIAEKWAEAYDYPLRDPGDLARVAQFLTISKKTGMWPKLDIKQQFLARGLPDFTDPDEPHALLADLNLPVYITTNYDNFMVEALKSRNRVPVQEFCRWNDTFEQKGVKPAIKRGYAPSSANPLVFHLHGHLDEPQSMVLTEGDYLDFLINLSRSGTPNQPDLLPQQVRAALVSTTLLFVGYRLADWNFRVILRGLVGKLKNDAGYLNVAVQMLPKDVDLDEATRARAQEYLTKYMEQIGSIQVQVFWGEARTFVKELRARLG